MDSVTAATKMLLLSCEVFATTIDRELGLSYDCKDWIKEGWVLFVYSIKMLDGINI